MSYNIFMNYYNDITENKKKQFFLVNLLSVHAFLNEAVFRKLQYNEYVYEASGQVEYYCLNIEYLKKKKILSYSTKTEQKIGEKEYKINASLEDIERFFGAHSLPESIIEYVNNITLGNDTYGKNNADFLKKEMKARYILGTGVSSGYGPENWENTILNMKNALSEIMDLPITEIDDTIGKLFGNVNIGIPELLNQVDKKEYNEQIRKGMFKELPDADTNLRIIADSLCTDKSDKQVLTFNFDIYLEKELFRKKRYKTEDNESYLENMDNQEMRSILPSNKDLDIIDKLTIIHNHGWIYENKNGIQTDKIVFTNGEYINAYQSPNSACYKTLDNHLKETCVLVGNSATDYEEQKVMKVRHDKRLSEFHYMLQRIPGLSKNTPKDVKQSEELILKKKRGSIEAAFYKMGIIILWFKEYDDIGTFIKEHFC